MLYLGFSFQYLIIDLLCLNYIYGSIQVAEKLMIMHEECLDGNFSSIGSLRENSRKRVAHPHVRQVKFLHDLNLMDLMVLNFL